MATKPFTFYNQDVVVQGLSGSGDGYVAVDTTGKLKFSSVASSYPPSGSAGGDLSGSYPNPVVAKLQGNPIQSATFGSLQDGYVLTWINADGYVEAKPPSSILSLGKVYEFENAVSDISTYAVLDGIAGVEADLSVSITSGSGKTLIKSFATALGSPNVNYIPAGQWDFDFYSYVSITAGVTQFVFDVYIRTAGGTETLLFTTTTPDINFTTVTQSTITYSFPTDTNVNSTDRIVCKVSAITTAISTVTTHFVFDGTTHASHLHTPIPGAATLLGGDLSGNTGNATVNKINHTSVSASPSANQLLVATGSTTSVWSLLYDGYVASAAAIAGTKISPAFGSQNISTTGTLAAGTSTLGQLTAGTTTTNNTITGGLIEGTFTATTNVTLSDGYNVIFVNTASGAITLTLPTPVNGRWFKFIDIGYNMATNNLIIARHSTEKIINIAGNLTLKDNGLSFALISDGTNWYNL